MLVAAADSRPELRQPTDALAAVLPNARTPLVDGPHHFLISDLERALREPLERALYRTATRDDDVFHTFEAVGSRRRSPATLLAPWTLWQIARAA